MNCYRCISPYSYPGLKGGPFHPIVSDWPSPSLVVDTFCHVFNTTARGMRFYRTSVKRIGPRVGMDDITGAHGCDLVVDLRAMCVYFMRNYCLWLASPGDNPERYTFPIIGQFFGKNKSWAHLHNRRASDLLLKDAEFRSLFNEALEELKKKGFKAVQVPRYA